VDKEVVIHPRWSPIESKLALVVGNITGQHIAFWSPGSFEELSKNDYISINGIKWDTTGKYLDFVAENPSDKFGLYQLNISNKNITKVQYLTRDEMINWIKK